MINYKSILFFSVSVFNIGTLTSENHKVTCGIDFSSIGPVYEGVGDIETYPWLGILFHPLGDSKVTTVVVLVTKQLVIGSANEIDKVPKDHFRALSRVVLGSNCSGSQLRVRDYTYHPEYEAGTYSALALIQLEVDEVDFVLHHICGPPTYFNNPSVYAITLNEDCDHPVVKIHEMTPVKLKECRRFYRRTGLDMKSMWPTHATCARALSGGECVWRSGAALVTKLGGRWHLLGFGVYGPGCKAPARFLDYGIYRAWVKNSVARMGKPAITRISPTHMILRRSTANLQRFGMCDIEEVEKELYTDSLTFDEPIPKSMRIITYNVTIYDRVEYSCVIFRVYHKMKPTSPTPMLHLHRWCGESRGMCSGFQYMRIYFYVEIEFVPPITFKMAAYGKQAKVIDVKGAMKYVNKMQTNPPIPLHEDEIKLDRNRFITDWWPSINHYYG